MNLDEFNKVPFTNEMPGFVLDLVDYLTGTRGLYQRALVQNLGGGKGKRLDGSQFDQTMSRYDSVTALSQITEDHYQETSKGMKGPPQAPSNTQSEKCIVNLP